MFIITPFFVIIDEYFAMHMVISLSSTRVRKKIQKKTLGRNIFGIRNMSRVGQ